MFPNLLDRLFSRRAPAAVPPPAPARTAAVARATTPEPLVEAPVGLGARRPLVSASGLLAGFEFGASAAILGRLRPGSGDAAIRACVTNVLGAMRLCLNQKMIALAELPAGSLARIESDGDFRPGMHIILGADTMVGDSAAMSALLVRLRRLGVALGWSVAGPSDMPVPPGQPDFAVVRQGEGAGADAWRRSIDAAAAERPGVPLLLLDIDGVDLMESLLRPPVEWAACAVGSNIAAARVNALAPQAQRLLQLLNRLVRDDDNALLVADIKADANLALRLLQYLNSAGATPGRELDSIDQAVLVLGRDALYRWVAQMLVRLSPQRPAAEALRALALARARLLEMLARDVGEASPGSFFLLGLASMLPLLLQCSVEDATASLQLPPPAMEALRLGTGPWNGYLSLALALERYDMATTEQLAQPFGGLEVVLCHSTQAWLPN